jgi:hypothetical protein
MKSLIKQLRAARREAEREVEQISDAIAALNGAGHGAKLQHTISAAGRKRISLAQKKRWAKARRR